MGCRTRWTTTTYGTSPYVQDSDGDGFDDLFEVNHRNQGFNPDVPDPRGVPLNKNCDISDTDGDGLSTCAEQYLGTDVGIVDSDADGIPDGLEVRYGFDPTHHDDFAHQDSDGDGISDLDELRANTDPTIADAQLYATDGYQYAVKSTVQPNNSVCYDITITNLKLFEVQSGKTASTASTSSRFGSTRRPRASSTPIMASGTPRAPGPPTSPPPTAFPRARCWRWRSTPTETPAPTRVATGRPPTSSPGSPPTTSSRGPAPGWRLEIAGRRRPLHADGAAAGGAGLLHQRPAL